MNNQKLQDLEAMDEAQAQNTLTGTYNPILQELDAMDEAQGENTGVMGFIPQRFEQIIQLINDFEEWSNDILDPIINFTAQAEQTQLFLVEAGQLYPIPNIGYWMSQVFTYNRHLSNISRRNREFSLRLNRFLTDRKEKVMKALALPICQLLNTDVYWMKETTSLIDDWVSNLVRRLQVLQQTWYPRYYEIMETLCQEFGAWYLRNRAILRSAKVFIERELQNPTFIVFEGQDIAEEDQPLGPSVNRKIQINSSYNYEQRMNELAIINNGLHALSIGIQSFTTKFRDLVCIRALADNQPLIRALRKAQHMKYIIQREHTELRPQFDSLRNDILVKSDEYQLQRTAQQQKHNVLGNEFANWFDN